MFETIVWATDGSELADTALPYVTELARLHHSKIVAVHANEMLRGRFGNEPLLADEPDLRKKVEQQVAELRANDFDTDLEIRSGSDDIPLLIANAAHDVGADVIVVGTHGHGGVAATLLGSIARGLTHTANCPVLVVPPPQRVKPPETEQVGAA